MAAVNLFIGGTGVNLAVLVRAYAAFYKLEERPRIFAIDTDASLQDVAQRTLGKALVLSAPGFLDRVKALSNRHLQDNFSDIWDVSGRRSHSFGDPLLYSGAGVVRDNFEAAGGLWTLRGAGWLAFEDLNEKNPKFVQMIASDLAEVFQKGEGKKEAVLNVVASIAGGTGSGLFIPLITAIRRVFAPNPDKPLLVHLHVVLPSAFENNWRGARKETVLRTRGQAGAFAAFREIMYLAEEADEYAKPEERTVNKLPYQGKLIDKVFWWGRREVDALSEADDTFYEAGKLVTLLNDRSAADAIFNRGAGVGYSRLVAGIATIEYPKLERAQAMAAFSVRHMVDQIVRGKPARRGESILKLGDEKTCPPLLAFIRDQRSENQALGSKLGSGRFEYAKVRSDLLPSLKAIRNGAPSDDAIANEVTRFVGGRILGNAENYRATTDSDWKDYLDRALASFQKLEDHTLDEMRNYCTWLPFAAESWIAEATARTIHSSSDPAAGGLPSLEKVRQSIVALVEDLDRARVAFTKPPDESILGGPGDEPFVTADQMAQKVEQHKVRLSEMTWSNPSFKREPPRGPLYHPFLQVVAVVVTLGFLISALARSALVTLPVVGGLIGAASGLVGTLGSLANRAAAPFASLPRILPAFDLPPAAGVAIAFALFLILRLLRERAFTEKPELRQREEEELKRDWSVLVEYKMLQMLWDAAVTTCGRVVGSVDETDVGKGRRPSVSSSLGMTFELLDTGAKWLDDLGRHADKKKQAAMRERPGWVKPVDRYEDPEAAQVGHVLPRVEIDARAPSVATVRRVTEVALAFASKGADSQAQNGLSPRYDFGGWKPENERSEIEKEAHDQKVGSFYASLEDAVLPAVDSSGLVKRTLDEAMTWGPSDLARNLDDLAERGYARGEAAELTKRADLQAILCVPSDKVRDRVDESIALARSSGLNNAKDLPSGDSIIVSQNIGQSIALIHVGQFDDEHEIREIREDAQSTYYGKGHTGRDPRETDEYDAGNTEFHLLPELSTASDAELRGRSMPTSALVMQRLHGSHQAVSSTPSLIEAFYLARVRGYLDEWESEETRQTAVLKVGTSRVPLLSVDSTGDVFPRDDFSQARVRMAVFDAFRTCLAAASLNFGQAPVLTAPRGAKMRSDRWSTAEIGAAVASVKKALLAEWRELRGKDGEARRRETYTAMRAAAADDSSLMREDVADQWRHVTNVVFDRGERILQGQAGVWAVGAPAQAR